MLAEPAFIYYIRKKFLKPVKVLIACEFSGVVREAFKLRGHDTWSCDLLPSEIKGNHYQDDIFNVINNGFDLMIGHPPCTYISYAGTRFWNDKGRIKKRLEALEFFRKLWEAPIDKICLENPKSCASPVIAKYNQEIQPYYFGDKDLKTTWLWLKNLPLLIHDKEDTLFNKRTHANRPEPYSIDNTDRAKKRYFTDTSRNGHIRSKTFKGIANAMAEQWG